LPRTKIRCDHGGDSKQKHPSCVLTIAFSFSLALLLEDAHGHQPAPWLAGWLAARSKKLV